MPEPAYASKDEKRDGHRCTHADQMDSYSGHGLLPRGVDQPLAATLWPALLAKRCARCLPFVAAGRHRERYVDGDGARDRGSGTCSRPGAPAPDLGGTDDVHAFFGLTETSTDLVLWARGVPISHRKPRPHLTLLVPFSGLSCPSRR